MPSQIQAMLPDVMSQGQTAAPPRATTTQTMRAVVPPPETIEEKVARLRPKTLRMQFRYLKTLVFALRLFVRLIFWQVYVAKVFPGTVKRGNISRWQKYAREFRYFAVDMGGVMIKAGQFASTRADVIPEAVIAELVSLQDEVPTLPYPQISKVLVRELGDLDARYTFIDQTPIAAASLGQVHRATLINGDRVVVKVQRPGIREVVYTDMAALFIVAHVAKQFSFIRRRIDAVGLIEEFGRVLLEEISYVTEANHAERFKKMFADDPGVYIPTIYRDHCTDYVLTMEDVSAIKLNDYAALDAAGIDRREVSKRLMDTYTRQIFEERFFHADPHPGNLFLYPLERDPNAPPGTGTPFYLIFIDFGMIGTLTPEIVQGIVNTLAAVITRDAHRLVKSYQELGFLLPSADVRRIEEATEAVFQRVWGMNMTELSAMGFDAAQDIGREFGDLLREMPFRVPQDFIYLGRTVGILGGMTTTIDPSFNPWQDIQENVQKLITTDEDANIFKELQAQYVDPFIEPLKALMNGDAQAFLASAQILVRRLRRPNPVEDMLRELISGDAQITTRLASQHRRHLERIEAQGQRTTRAVLFATFMLSGTMFYTSGDVNVASLLYVLAAVMFVLLVFTRK
jgi:predicted unusual protein kinase regulating ubiquinone biosynthesis (AarF/ABC1/UbiB family)